MTRPRALIAAALGLIVVLTLVVLARSVGGGADDESDAAPGPPAPLEPAWTADLDTSAVSEEAARQVGDLVVIPSASGYTALDGRSGEQRWTHRVRGGHCATSSGPGKVAVYLSGAECTTMVALDLTSGEQLWRRRIPQQNQGGVNLKVEVGDRAVTLRGSCDQVLRFRRKDGADLGVIAPVDRVCGNETDIDGQLVAVWHDPETEGTPDEVVSGWVPPHDGVGALELWDADTGKMIWRREQARRGAGLGGIVSSDPLVLATERAGQATMRKFNARNGRPGAFVGARLTNDDGLAVLGRADGVLVGSYDGMATVGYRLDDGQQAWQWTPDGPAESAVGVGGSSLVVGRQVGIEHDDTTEPGLWLTRRSIEDGEAQGAVGWIPRAQRLEVVGDLLLAHESEGLRAYRLGEADPELQLPESAAGDQLAPGWEKGDITSVPASVPCPISVDTVKAMGFRTTDLPPPADCAWQERYQPDGVERSLTSSITLVQPARGTAVEEAEATVESLLENSPVAVDGWGDEAWVFAAGTPDRSRARAKAVVRVRNVIVTAEAELEALATTDRAEVGDLAAVERALRGAVTDQFAAIDIDIDEPTPAADGAVKHVGGLCALAAPDASVLVPGAPGVSTRPGRVVDPERRVSGCAWEGAGDQQPGLNVSAIAVPGSPLTAEEADEVADQLVGQPRADERRIRGLGDRAKVRSFNFRKGLSRTETLTARKGNLVVVVEYRAWHQFGGDARKRMDDEVIRIGRTILRELG